MKKLVIAMVCCVASVAFAENKMEKTSVKTAETKSVVAESKPMTFTPRKVTHEDKKGIDAMYAAHEAAMMKGDMEAMASIVDFPVYMATDNAKGEVFAQTWDKKKWMEDMTASMQSMPKDMKVKHDRKYTFLTDTMVIVVDNPSAKMAGKMESWKGSEMVIKKDGKWMIKTMAEGGWGDGLKSPEGSSAAGSR